MSGGYVRVINIRHVQNVEPGEVVFRVDRTNPVLGNPFVLANKHDAVQRDVVIKKFTYQLVADIAVQGRMYAMVKQLAERVINGEKICLACWCSPLPCHGDVIAKSVYELVEKLNGKNI